MIYFVSGHRNLSYEDFEKYYIPKIKSIIEEDNHAKFIVGDCDGVDKFTMDYIFNNTDNELTIYHMFDKPRNTPNNEHPIKHTSDNNRHTHFKNGYKSDEDRDSAMTRDSNFDVAFIKDNRWNSGTAQNIKRRYNLK